MRSRGQVEIHPFDPEPERTLHHFHREQREALHRNLAIMQNNVKQDHGQEQNEPQGVTMGIMVGIRYLGCLYSQMIH